MQRLSEPPKRCNTPQFKCNIHRGGVAKLHHSLIEHPAFLLSLGRQQAVLRHGFGLTGHLALGTPALMTAPATFDEIEAEFEALADEWDDKYRLLIDLGRELEAMPSALKTDATRVRGCASQVWLYPAATDDQLHFLADSDAAIVKGLVALVLMLVQDRRREEIDVSGVKARLDALGLSKHLSSNRTQGLASMLARIGELAAA